MTTIEFVVLDLLARFPQGLSWYALEAKSPRHPAFEDFEDGPAHAALKVLREIGLVIALEPGKQPKPGLQPKNVLTAIGMEALVSERIHRGLAPYPPT